MYLFRVLTQSLGNLSALLLKGSLNSNHAFQEFVRSSIYLASYDLSCFFWHKQKLIWEIYLLTIVNVHLSWIWAPLIFHLICSIMSSSRCFIFCLALILVLSKVFVCLFLTTYFAIIRSPSHNSLSIFCTISYLFTCLLLLQGEFLKDSVFLISSILTIVLTI